MKMRGGLQAHYAVVLKEAMEAPHNKNLQGVLSREEVARWIREARNEVEGTSTAGGPTCEAVSKLREEVEHHTSQTEVSQAQM